MRVTAGGPARERKPFQNTCKGDLLVSSSASSAVKCVS